MSEKPVQEKGIGASFGLLALRTFFLLSALSVSFVFIRFLMEERRDDRYKEVQSLSASHEKSINKLDELIDQINGRTRKAREKMRR